MKKARFASMELQFLRTLGCGSFGEVFLARVVADSSDLMTEGGKVGDYMAVKRMPLSKLSEKGVQQAIAEAHLLQQLGEESEYILKCFGAHRSVEPSAALELLLEYAPLGDLNQRICKKKASPSSVYTGLPEGEALSYSHDIAAGLAYIHERDARIIHRDVKPANVVLFNPDADGRFPLAKLADFGIAKVLENEGPFAGAATVIGTPHYFSPEVCRGEIYDEQSDAWALGCVIYEMICLRRPFHKAEGNLALLALRIAEGNYDSGILEDGLVGYSADLLLIVKDLLEFDPLTRCRASESLQMLQRLQVGCTGAEQAWWQNLRSPGASSGQQDMLENETFPFGSDFPDEARPKEWSDGLMSALEKVLLTELPTVVAAERPTSPRGLDPMEEFARIDTPLNSTGATVDFLQGLVQEPASMEANDLDVVVDSQIAAEPSSPQSVIRSQVGDSTCSEAQTGVSGETIELSNITLLFIRPLFERRPPRRGYECDPALLVSALDTIGFEQPQLVPQLSRTTSGLGHQWKEEGIPEQDGSVAEDSNGWLRLRIQQRYSRRRAGQASHVDAKAGDLTQTI